MSTTPEPKVEVKSAPPLHALTDAQRKERYKQLRAKMGESRLTVAGKPGVHYFWGPRTDDNEMIRLDSMGYTLVRESEPALVKQGKKVPEVRAQGLRDDGTYVIGDVILMQCAQEDYEFFLLDVEERHANQTQAIIDEFRDMAEKQGIPTFTVDRSQK